MTAPPRTPSRTFATALVAALALLGGGCHHGKFVGADFLPKEGYAGDRVPEAQLATVTPGWVEGTDGVAQFVGVDDLRCDDDMGVCTLVTRVPAGPHAFHLRLHGDWIRWPTGYSPAFTVDAANPLEAGVVYAVVPEAQPDGELGGRVERLCPAADPIATVKAYHLRKDWRATCRPEPAPKGPAAR